MKRPRKGRRQDRGQEQKPAQNDGQNPLAKLDPEKKQELLTAEIKRNPSILATPEIRSVMVAMVKSHSGPLPAPEDFEAYEKAHPGSCDRILKMAEKAQQDGNQLNESRMKGDLAEAARGQLFAFMIAIAGIAGATVTAVMGAPWQVSVALGGGSLALVIAPFFKKAN